MKGHKGQLLRPLSELAVTSCPQQVREQRRAVRHQLPTQQLKVQGNRTHLRHAYYIPGLKITPLFPITSLGNVDVLFDPLHKWRN